MFIHNDIIDSESLQGLIDSYAHYMYLREVVHDQESIPSIATLRSYETSFYAQLLLDMFGSGYKGIFLCSGSNPTSFKVDVATLDSKVISAQGHWHYLDIGYKDEQDIALERVLSLQALGLKNPRFIPRNEPHIHNPEDAYWDFLLQFNKSTELIQWPAHGWPEKIEEGSYDVVYIQSDKSQSPCAIQWAASLAKDEGIVFATVHDRLLNPKKVLEHDELYPLVVGDLLQTAAFRRHATLRNRLKVL